MLFVFVLPVVMEKLLNFDKITLFMYITVSWKKSPSSCIMTECLRLLTQVTGVYALKIAINKQKAKFPGPDGTSMEAYIYTC